jgi:hypothetical protein
LLASEIQNRKRFQFRPQHRQAGDTRQLGIRKLSWQKATASKGHASPQNRCNEFLKTGSHLKQTERN